MTELDIFCRNFRYLREISGLSLEEMAKCVGISVYSVKTTEQGRVPRTVNIETLLAIFVSFGVTTSDMFIGDKEIILKKYQRNRRMLQ